MQTATRDRLGRGHLLPVLLLVVALGACAPPRVVEAPEVVAPDTTVGAQRADSASYRVETLAREAFTPRRQEYDILHTRLDLSFDFEHEHLHGLATHRLTPLDAGLDSLAFDAVDMDIHSVVLSHAGWSDSLTFEFDAGSLVAYPVEALRAIDTVEVAISYTAHPNRSPQIRGLHFVDGPGADPSLPTQVWTLSQPEDGRYWFPTWDYPNDFMTFTISMTVPERLQTFSNGELRSQRQQDGLRTDTWHLDRPHVPYLAAFAVGEFASVPDTFLRDDSTVVPLLYVVEPEYEADALAIFAETRPMLEVFERRIGMRYPWSNYKQVCVREFTAGGMEHTTMSTMNSRLQRDTRARLDNTSRDLIAHELVHQWFGNLLTSADWAHLSLNEGFAQYFEQVYLEDGVGEDEAQEHAITDLRTYLHEAASLRRPIVWYGYSDPYELYDAHTYSKAARVLNQLRFHVGEEAWWEGIRSYVRDNRHRNVTAEDLQQTMEAASGRDLELFFEQWFYSPGHPELVVEQGPDDELGLYQIRVRQVQDTLRTPLFDFDVEFEVQYLHRQPFRGRVNVSTADTTFRIGTAGDIAFVRFNSGTQLLADIQTLKPLREWVEQAVRSAEMAARYEAVSVLSDQEPSQIVRDALADAVNDSYDLVRMQAIRGVRTYVPIDAGIRRLLMERAAEDGSARVRAAAVEALRHSPESDEVADLVLRDALQDSSYTVTARAVEVFGARRPEASWEAFQHLLTLESGEGVVERALAATIPSLPVDDRMATFLLAHARPDRPVQVRRAVAQMLSELPADAPARAERTNALRRLLMDLDENVRLAAARAAANGDHDLDRAYLRERTEAEASDEVRSVLMQAGVAEPVNQ